MIIKTILIILLKVNYYKIDYLEHLEESEEEFIDEK
jgi:hypothetical protein